LTRADVFSIFAINKYKTERIPEVNYALIMAGGKGERFWPLSRTEKPKQLLKITSDKTMLEETIERMEEFIPAERIRIITGQSMKTSICDILPEIDSSHVWTEPFGRNTCLAIAYSALKLQREDPEAIMVVLSSDHLIKPKEKLIDELKVAIEICQKGDYLITLGITPTRPESGYGYIETGDLFKVIEGISVYSVSEFKEKPDRITAQQYYYGRKHLWNSGMFVWSARTILDRIEKHMPAMWKDLKSIEDKLDTPQEDEAVKELYLNSENVSIDVAILENASPVLTVKADLVWDDVGSWLALDRIEQRDKDNNIIKGNVANLGSFESIIYNESDGLIATIGVTDLMIVKTDNIVMVAHKTQINQLKKLLSGFHGDENLEKYL
jgi:mannose-1-phosphate guanylyltransferase